MTNEEWLKHFAQAYLLPFREDIRVNKWKKLKFTEMEKHFLLTKYSTETITLHQDHISEINQIWTRYFFKMAIKGYAFCSLEKIKSEFGKTLEENYGVTIGPFYNLLKTFWTFRIQLDEDSGREREHLPLFYLILRDIEINIAGAFFPTGGQVNESNQRQILKEFAPEMDIEEFITDNPMLKRRKGSWLGRLLKRN